MGFLICAACGTFALAGAAISEPKAKQSSSPWLCRGWEVWTCSASKNQNANRGQIKPNRIGRRQVYSWFAKHHSALSVRKKSSPSVAANDALVGSPTELVARTSNFGEARNTNVSQD